MPGLAGEERRGKAGRKTPLLNLLGLSPRRDWLPKCGLRTNLWPQLCFLTCSRKNAHKSEAQGKAVINSLAAGRKRRRTVVLCLPLAPGVPPNVPACTRTSTSLLNLTQGHYA